MSDESFISTSITLTDGDDDSLTLTHSRGNDFIGVEFADTETEIVHLDLGAVRELVGFLNANFNYLTPKE